MVRCFVVLCLWVMLTSVGLADDKDKSDEEGKKLRVLRSFFVPLKEISGMVRGAKGEILAIGDDAPLLGLVAIDNNDLELVQTFNFTRTMWQKFFLCPGAQNDVCSELSRTITSEWEGLYYYPDSEEIAVLQESTGSIITFDQQLRSIKAHTVLDFMLKTGKETNSSNSLGEGFLPLASGRILVAREKNPAALVEFGMLGESAAGYQAKDSKLATSRPADDTDRHVLYPLHSWYLQVDSTDPEDECDLSDITVASNGKLYGVSQVCRQVYQFDDLSPRSDKLEVKAKWDLPLQMATAESLIVIKEGVFLVAVDTKEDINSVFLVAEKGEKDIEIGE